MILGVSIFLFWIFPYLLMAVHWKPSIHQPVTTNLPLWHRPHVAPWVTNFQNEHLRFRMVWNWWKCLGFVGEQPSIWKLMILSKKLYVFFLIFIQETGKYLIFGDLDIAYRQCSCESSSVCEQIHIYWYTHWKHQKASVLQNLRWRFCKSAELVSNSSLQIYASKGIHGKKHSLFK